MSYHTNKSLFKTSSIFPYAPYLARSYSPVTKPKEKEVQKTNDLNCFIQGWAISQLTKELEPKDKKYSYKLIHEQKISQIPRITLFPCDVSPKLQKNHKKYKPKVSKTIFKSTSMSPIKKQKITQNKALQAFYRNQLISLFSLLSRKEDYINFLKGKGQQLVDPLKLFEIEERLTKQLQSKGKDKGRQKFNYVYNQQLKSLKYKARYGNQTLTKKPSKIEQCQPQQQEEEVEEYKNYNMDMQTWKRKNGVGFNQKVFIIKGGYYQLRRSLIERGWYENEDVWSPHFDFKWTTKICDINYLNLRNHQSVNHFNNNHHLTSKYGLSRRLRTLILSHGVDIDKFYPRCYDLGDQVDFENFIQNFKFGFAESVARRFLVDKTRYHKLQLKMRIIIDILRRRLTSFSQKINQINKGQFPIIKPEQWAIITETAELTKDQQKAKLKFWRKKQPQKPSVSHEDEKYEEELFQIFNSKISNLVELLKIHDPQTQMNGFRNVWICKPNFMSRGIGIRCYNNLYDITDYCCGGTGQFVVQKYIEHPLLIEEKKFDIRQWVLIQDFCPPKIWFYDDCYIRFCADDFSLENIYNKHIHLTNNSVQKYNKNGNIEKSMWSMEEFSEFIGIEKWKQIQEKIKNIVVWSIKSCEGYVLGRKGSCELVGYDLMIDQNLDPWLIEINMSPSMEHSTPVTKKLVKKVLNDTAKVISSNKKSRNTGNFQCIYEGNGDLPKYDCYRF